MTIKIIEQNTTMLIQKVTHGPATIGYNVVPKEQIGNAAAIVRVRTLTEARDKAGILTVFGVKQPMPTQVGSPAVMPTRVASPA